MALYVKFDCATCENENCYGHGLPATEKVCDGYKHTATNADRIRAMSDEELAEKFFLFPCVHVLDDKVICKDDGCKKCWMRWLREEVKE